MMNKRAERRRAMRKMIASEAAKAKHEARKTARRALLQRQTRREKAGFYDGQRAVAKSISPSRSRKNSTKNPLKISKGKAFGRILRTYTDEDRREVQIHATKGRRTYRAA